MEFFQTFEYKGKVLKLAAYQPETSAKASSIKAPGAGKFEIGTVKLSADKITAGEELTLTAQVSGKNIAYIYSEILLHDKSLGQFYGPVARDYIQADQNKERSGVRHPDWGDAINIAVKLNPSLRLLTDGVDSAFGFLIPASYSSSEVYLDGLYAPTDGATQRRARITFDSAGEIAATVAYKDQGSRGIPHAIKFKQGDQFTPFVQILTQSADDNQTWQVTKGLSTPLTFHDQPFHWAEEPLMPADYLVGLVIQDLDGGFTRKYAPLFVGE